ncbi:alpha methylacyl-CoA racemase [Aspergillus homomorphus CBS 101889]|uniref:Alpha methylacyl-CoA racemase n=1 Tax=Aspergillus homomorphus (strain CBS 101889) TaxID=1450537 RepID=A0A395I792_ASPHC|nr:alpha methylacyl-CoA racemase [Aspergillus homomorphus CBS 101889]RAL16070.1 alpha methylacyl-CoA racemase [Aspergillus homomorphus CBS 101889]
MALEEYSLPNEAAELLRKGILQNPLLASNVPADGNTLAAFVEFSGNAKPSIPVNWRFAESISALKGLEALWLNALLRSKYNREPVHVQIDTDHATLFIMSTLLLDVVDDQGLTLGASSGPIQRLMKIFPAPGEDPEQGSLYRAALTNIYKTKDARFYHVHGSLDATPSLTALNLPLEYDAPSTLDAIELIQHRVSEFDSQELDALMNEKFRQAGTICYTTDEYMNTDHGRQNADAGLYELQHISSEAQKPVWWNSTPDTGVARPLAGLKVVDLTRVIAGPSIARGLAEHGASVMRVTGPGVLDAYALHADLNWGKWNCSIDLKTERGKEELRQLIRGADIVLDGYRPGVMEKLGFGREAVLEIVKDRPFGLIYARENCYGWHGPWKGRSGWQQISDAVCGVSYQYGRATGHDEPVTPIFPNSDYCTGVAGLCGIIDAIIQRAERGGSFYVDTALNYYSQWLVNSVGEYPKEVWEEVWQRHGRLSFRHYDNMPATIPAVMNSLSTNCAPQLFQPRFFEVRYSAAVDRHFKSVRPILTFPGSEVTPKFNVGTRSNGHDAARWPDDLRQEIIA